MDCSNPHTPSPLIAAPDLPAPLVPLGPRQDEVLESIDLNSAAFRQAEDDLLRIYRPFDQGTTRLVVDGGPVVYKIGDEWSQHNELHAYLNPRTAHGLPVAPCRMVYHANGCPILIMQTVRPATSWEGLPEWAVRVDSAQVGFLPSGEVAIFDAGYPIPGPDYEQPENPSDRTQLMSHPLPSIFAA